MSGICFFGSSGPQVSVECRRMLCSSYCFRAIRGQTGPKSHFFKVPQIFILHHIFMRFVSSDSVWPKLSVECRKILHSSDYYRAIRGTKAPKLHFFNVSKKKTLFVQIFMRFVSLDPSWPKLSVVCRRILLSSYSFRAIWVKGGQNRTFTKYLIFIRILMGLVCLDSSWL